MSLPITTAYLVAHDVREQATADRKQAPRPHCCCLLQARALLYALLPVSNATNTERDY